MISRSIAMFQVGYPFLRHRAARPFDFGEFCGFDDAHGSSLSEANHKPDKSRWLAGLEAARGDPHQITDFDRHG